MGRNGAGKSTLLRVAAGLPSRRAAHARAGRVGAAAAEPGRLLAPRAVGDEPPAAALAARGARRARRPPPARPLRRRAPAARAGVVPRASPRRRAASTSPRAAWTAGTRSRSRPDCATLAAAGAAVLVATHDAEFAAAFAARAVLLGDGATVADAPTAEVLAGGWYFATQTARILGGRRAAARARRRAAAARARPAAAPRRSRLSWLAASLVVLGLALVAGFAWYERSHPTARVLALVATLAALAALGRIAFAPLPNVKPTTDIVLLTGYALGGAPGFAVGAVAALASNVFFGQGPWTPWQMGAWGGVGVGGALLARAAGRELGRVALAAACALAGLGYGAVMNLALWATFSGDHSLEQLGFIIATSLPFDVAHAVGNVAVLPRLRAGARARAAALPVALRDHLAPGAGPRWPRSPRSRWSRRAARRRAPPAARVGRLPERAQNADGGFGGAPGQRSTGSHGVDGLGLAAAGRNPLDVAPGRGGRARLRGRPPRPRDETSGRCQAHDPAQRGGGRGPRGSASRDLVARAAAPPGAADGSFAGRVDTAAFAVLALRAAGRPEGDRAVRAAEALDRR